MFGKLSISSFKAPPETFKINFGFAEFYGEPGAHRADGALGKESVSIDWPSSASEAEVLQRVSAALNDPDLVSERVQAELTAAADHGSAGVVTASTYRNAVHLRLSLHTSKPALRSVELLRTSGSGTITTTLGLGLWSLLDVGSITSLRCNEGAASLWDERVLCRFQSLRVVNLSHANLTSLPGVIGTLEHLQELRLVGNRLKILPPELGRLHKLRILAADSNELSILPGELRRCTALEELTLENNRLTSVLLNFSAFPRLQVLHLFNNPLEFLPEISPCSELRNLSVANLRVSADRDFNQFRVELLQPTVVAPTINMSLFDSKSTDILRPIFSLLLRRSSGHHQLLAGALRHLAEDPKNRDAMAKQENALHQLILMSLNDNEVVVEQTCMTLTSMALHSAALADAIVQADLGSMLGLLDSREPKLQLSSLRVLAAIGFASATASDKLLSDKLLSSLKRLATDVAAAAELRAAALEALGNLAFGSAVKKRLAGQHELMQTLHQLATSGNLTPILPQRVKSAALRMLAILGENEAVGRAVGRQPVRGRGLRILSMDGGGMKGMATVRLLRQLEARTGRPVHELFDLIVGTSTGGLLAVALGLRRFSLDECEAIYKVLGQQVFSRAAVNKDKEESWTESLLRAFHTKTQHVRAVVVGYKHDASVYETLLKDYCDVAKDRRCLSGAMIDTACLDAPKVALVATLASTSPAAPFVFRNYELPPATGRMRDSICAHKGSSKHAVWQAVRASSAAIYYLDDFSCGNEKFQDGAVVANNPAVVALQEARMLWPDAPIDVFVSVGTGSTPNARRDKGMSSFVDTGNILIESATSVDRVHEALATMLPMVPKLQYFRFNPVDPRCNMELDEIDPVKWASLESAIDDYIATHKSQLDGAAAALLQALEAGAASSLAQLRLGTRRGLMVVTASPSVADPSAADIAAAACSRLPMCIGVLDLQAADGGSCKHGAVHPNPGNPATAAKLGSHPIGVDAKALRAAAQESAAASGTASSSTQAQAAAGSQDAQLAVVEVDLGSAIGSVFNWFSPTKPSRSAPTSPAATVPEQGAQAHPKLEASSAPGTPGVQSAAVAMRAGDAAGAEEAGASQGDVLEMLENKLEEARPSAGILHLALHQSSGGLALQWQEQLQAVTEPSAVSAELLRKAGLDPATISLAQVFEKHESIEVEGSELRLISKQSQRFKGRQLSVLLMQHTSPVKTLDAAAISRLRGVLSGQLVVCSAALAEEHVSALLKGGSMAVVCLNAAAGNAVERAGGRALANLFAALYSSLEQGASLVDALRKAGDAQPGLRCAFDAFGLEGGEAVRLKQ